MNGIDVQQDLSCRDDDPAEPRVGEINRRLLREFVTKLHEQGMTHLEEELIGSRTAVALAASHLFTERDYEG